MIAACPKCSARYRIERERVPVEGVRLRCSRCEAVFRVRAPGESAASARAPEPVRVVESPPPPPPSVEAPASPPRPSEPPPAPEATPQVAQAPAIPKPPEPAVGPPERLVLVADPMADEGKATAAALAAWGLQPILVHDGVEAILTIQRRMPRVAIIDAALPKMYGFQVCELLKRNESLRHVQVVLVGAVHDHTRYRRNPTEIYGADAYLERPQLPDALWPILRGFGLPVVGGSATPEPTPRSETTALDQRPFALDPQESALSDPPGISQPPVEPAPQAAEAPAPQPVPDTARQAPSPEATLDPALDAEIAKAERLARIVVSDIILYNQEKFDAAVAAGNVLDVMTGDLEEGRALFTQRIDERVRASRDFLAEELARVAGMRRSQ